MNALKCIGISVLAVLVGLSSGCGDAKKTSGGTTPAVGSAKDQNTAPTALATELAFKGKVDDFAKEVKEQSGKYKGKVVEVEGPVKEAPRFGEPTKLTLKGPGGAEIICTMSPEAQKSFRELGIGQNIKVAGKLTLAFGTTVVLDECGYQEAGANPVVKVSAKDLGKEFATGDGEAGAKKYDGKELLVDGFVVEVEEKGPVVKLDAGLPEALECKLATINVEDGDAFKKLGLKKGDKVVVKGSFRDNVIALKHYPGLSGACLVKKD